MPMPSMGIPWIPRPKDAPLPPKPTGPTTSQMPPPVTQEARVDDIATLLSGYTIQDSNGNIVPPGTGGTIVPNNPIAFENRHAIRELFHDLIRLKLMKKPADKTGEEFQKDFIDTLAKLYNNALVLTGQNPSPRFMEELGKAMIDATTNPYSPKPDVLGTFQNTRDIIRKDFFPEIESVQRVQWYEAFPNADLSKARELWFKHQDVPGANNELANQLDMVLLQSLDPNKAQQMDITQTPPGVLDEQTTYIMKDIKDTFKREKLLEDLVGRDPETVLPAGVSQIDINLSQGSKAEALRKIKSTPRWHGYIPQMQAEQTAIMQLGGLLDNMHYIDTVLGHFTEGYEPYVNNYIGGRHSAWTYDESKKKATEYYAKYKLGAIDPEYDPERPTASTAPDPSQKYTEQLKDYNHAIELLALVDASKYPLYYRPELIARNKELLRTWVKTQMPQDYEIASVGKNSLVPKDAVEFSSSAIANRLLTIGSENNWTFPAIPQFSEQYQKPSKEGHMAMRARQPIPQQPQPFGIEPL